MKATQCVLSVSVKSETAQEEHESRGEHVFDKTTDDVGQKGARAVAKRGHHVRKSGVGMLGNQTHGPFATLKGRKTALCKSMGQMVQGGWQGCTFDGTRHRSLGMTKGRKNRMSKHNLKCHALRPHTHTSTHTCTIVCDLVHVCAHVCTY